MAAEKREAAKQERGGRGPGQRKKLDSMGRKPRIPSQGVTFDNGGKGTVSDQEVDATRAGRSAANASGFGPMSDHSEATREYKQWSCSNSMLKSPPMRLGTLPEPSASNNASLQRVLVSRRLCEEPWALP